jgi:hypothetical protein
VTEDHLALGRRPADVVEMQVGEDDVGDVVRRDAVLTQARQELAAPVLAGIDGAGARVDQDDPVAGADQETAEGELQPAVRVEPRLVRGPGVGPGLIGPQQDVAGDLVAEAVQDRQDLDLADSHRVTPWPSMSSEGSRISSDTTWLP